MSRFVLVLFSTLFSNALFGQVTNFNYYQILDDSYINFESEPPQITPSTGKELSKMFQKERYQFQVVYNSKGEVVFYTDGFLVVDKNLQVGLDRSRIDDELGLSAYEMTAIINKIISHVRSSVVVRVSDNHYIVMAKSNSSDKVVCTHIGIDNSGLPFDIKKPQALDFSSGYSSLELYSKNGKNWLIGHDQILGFSVLPFSANFNGDTTISHKPVLEKLKTSYFTSHLRLSRDGNCLIRVTQNLLHELNADSNQIDIGNELMVD